MTRPDGRGATDMRPIAMELNIQRNPEGSLIYRSGETSVLISASTDEGSPDWRDSGLGWVTAEYAMHPRATGRRQRRDGRRGRVDARGSEIQRLIGRSLRACVDFEKLGERSVSLDCDVLDADGGTRTASVSGGFVALAMALESLRKRGLCKAGAIRAPIGAISVGLLDGSAIVDLNYIEDRDAEVDMNVVATADGEIVEIQGTAEHAPFARDKFNLMLDRAVAAIGDIVKQQRAALESAGIDLDRLMGK